MFKFGEYNIHIINDLLGVKRDPSKVYPNVKKSDWNAYKDFAQNKGWKIVERGTKNAGYTVLKK